MAVVVVVDHGIDVNVDVRCGIDVLCDFIATILHPHFP